MLTGKTINELPLGVPTPNSVYPFYDNGTTYKEIKPSVYTSLITMTGGTVLSPIVISNTLGFEPEWIKVSNVTSGFNFPTTVDYDKIFYTITPKLDITNVNGPGQIQSSGGYEFTLGSYIPNKIDDTFNIGSGFSNESFIDKPSVYVNQPFGSGFLIGGDFNSYSGVTCGPIIYLNNDGSINQSFVSPFPQIRGLTVKTIKIQSRPLSGFQFLVGGDLKFDTINNIIRLNTDGTIDETFSNGDGFDSTVNTIAVQSDNKILVGGDFSSYSGESYSRIIRLNYDGSIDETFNIGSGFNGTVYSITIQDDNKILVGGGYDTYNGLGYNGLIRLNTDGSVDETFNIGGGFMDNEDIGTINKININPSDNKILVVGSFISYSGVSCSNIIKLNLDGSIDETFNNNAQFQYRLNTITIQNDNKILVGGFNTVNRLNPNGSIDETFIVTMLIESQRIRNSVCYDITIQSDDKIVLTGQFSSINSNNKGDICRIENSSDGIVDFQITLLNGQEFTKVPFEIRNYPPLVL